jgi:Helix-turn-helix domain
MVSNGELPETDNTQGAAPADPARLDRLEHQVAELSGLIAAMQHAPAAGGEPAIRQEAALPDRWPSAGPPPADSLTYAGNVGAGAGHLVIVARRTVADVLSTDPGVAGRVFAALASPARITLLKTLLDGPQTTQQLRGVLDDPSVGQLYHHLKELLAAGLVVQPGRSMYALRRGTQVEVCILILAASGLASGTTLYPPPDAEQPPDPGEPPGPV